MPGCEGCGLPLHAKCVTLIYVKVKTMEKQNVTISIPKDVLKKAKHIALNRQTSLSRLLAETLEEIVEKDDAYGRAKERQLAAMKKGFDLGVKGKMAWKREDLHAR
jgi:predicted transcriptional regulator